MGVNTNIYLPHDVKLDDVADVIGQLLGLKVRWRSVKAIFGGGKYRYVAGVKLHPCEDMPQLCGITFSPPKGKTLVDGEDGHHVNYHFEPGSQYAGKYGRLLMPHAYPVWIAVAIRLAKFFGGKVVYRDCEGITKAYGTYANRYFPKPRATNCPEDGKPWEDFKEAKYSIEPLTQKDLDRANKVAAYKKETQ